MLQRYRFISSVTGLVAMAAGILVLTGWLMGIRTLTSVIPDYATIKVNTALCFILAGLSLWLLRHSSNQPIAFHPNQGRVGQVCALLVGFVGLLTIGESCLRLNFGIDEAFLHDIWTDARISPPGRMSIATAFGFFVVGSSLFFLGQKKTEDVIASQILALSGLIAGVFACLGYVYGVQGQHSISLYTTMAVHTASVLIILCVAILLARPDLGVISALTRRHSGRQIALLILPLSLMLPFLTGWLQLKGERAGLYGTEFGLALFATSNIILFTILVWLSTRSLNIDDQNRARDDLEHRVAGRSAQLAGAKEKLPAMRDAARVEKKQKEGEKALRLSEERFSNAFAYAAIGMALVSIDGRWLKVNQALCDLIGYSAGELSEKTFQDLTHPDDLEADRVKMGQMLAGEINFGKVEQRFFHKDGRLVRVSVSVSLLRDKQGKPLYLIAQIEDATDCGRRERPIVGGPGGAGFLRGLRP